jgi:O-antigen/teichoic acid export membrane protein
VICLAYLMFSLHSHFNVPALLEKKTVSLVPSHLAALLTNVAANLVLIPLFGTTGAAWASVCAFTAFSFVGLWVYRRIRRLDYPFGRCALVLAGAIATFIGWKILLPWSEQPVLSTVAALLIWCAWAGALGWTAGRALWRRWRERSRGAPPSGERQRAVEAGETTAAGVSRGATLIDEL